MKRILFLVIALTSVIVNLNAQSKPQVLKKVLELQMPKTADDDKPGTRGASVVWHPVQKKYYASFAGNQAYPMAVFDAKGKRLSDEELTTMMDTRGLWYNPTSKLITGNSYSDFGWFTYTLDKGGIPTEVITILEGMNQPGEQSVGVYNAAIKKIMFLSGSQIFFYDSTGTLTDSVTIHTGRTKSAGVSDDEDIFIINENYNYTSIVYIGVKGQEIGLLNNIDKYIELYDIKTGFLTRKLSLPEEATAEALFNFAYTNGIYWLFNIEMRKWEGYK